MEKNYEKFHKKCDVKTSSRPFFVSKNLAQPLLENETFKASYLNWTCISKTIKISPNWHTGLLRFFFTEDSLKIKKNLELVSRPHVS